MSLRKAFEKWSRTVCFQAPPDAAAEFAFEAYQAGYQAALNEPDDGWISVETPPENNGVVLSIRPGVITDDGIREIAYYEADTGEWFHADGTPINPTHWQLLPAAPKEKS